MFRKITQSVYLVGGSGEFSRCNLELVHTPGHTPGSIVAYLEDDGQSVLFGQDIHGPFSDFKF